jgi:tRNA pseudouridine-54 N-methylase
MSAGRLMSGRSGDEVSSPGVTIINKNRLAGIYNDTLILYQSSDGSDLRRVEFTGNTTYVCALDGEWRFGGIESFVEETPLPLIALKIASQTDTTILMINNEIDRQLGYKHTIA